MARLRGTGAQQAAAAARPSRRGARPRDGWTYDPFKLTEADGYFHGRGVIDDKAMAAIFVANLIEYQREGFGRSATSSWRSPPTRSWHVRRTTASAGCCDNERALIDAEFAINEGGGGALRNGQPFRLAVQLAEKVYQTYVLEVTDPGGHARRRAATTRSTGCRRR